MLDLKLFDGEELLALCQIDLEARQFDKALAKIKQGLSLTTYPPELLSVAGRVYAQLKLFKKAEKCFSEYLEQKPGESNTLFQYGMVLFDQGYTEQALNTWSKLLTEIQTHPPALFYSAIGNYKLRNANDAQRHLDVLLQSAEPTNLYVERAKELIDNLNGANSEVSSSSYKPDSDRYTLS